MDTANTRMSPCAADAVTELYAEHALGLVRLAVIVLGDVAAAEDVVQDAFLGLYRRWDQLPDTSHPLDYVRTSVLNGCRSALRRRSRRGLAAVFSQPPAESAEARALVSEEYRAVVTAIRALPRRQREALLLRYYLDMSEDEVARSMGVSRGTVKSATSRALAAIGRILTEES
ncbi:SigE family RNA polymerase sigma factor [Trebonia sp.]|uniref:SigE family RNA polymerase sigma factor n=1 Tax=Trebonia sp. TaxID=2767075 RepID=UPI002614DF56|nr:SigE family RNA polymerase sigma factor [Trebonia sp.]